MNRLRFNLNGQWVEEAGLSPTTTLLRYLRDVRHLTGTKEGCAEGDCGACTVVVVERDAKGAPELRAVNSCLVLLPMVQGKHVFTVEALKDAATGEPHPVQQALAKALGSQCGYCTPGIAMSMLEAAHRGELDATASARGWKLEDQLAGNLCRCTGYRSIRTAAEAVAGTHPRDHLTQGLAAPESMALDYQAGGQRFITPDSLGQLWDVLDAHPDARFVAGGTDLSLEVTKRFERPPMLVSLEGIAELGTLSERPDGFTIGATVTIANLEAFAETRLPPVHRMTRYFGARQIKHRGTVGGNLCNASPIGDLPPVLLSLGATAVLRSRGGTRRVPLDDFFVGYRKTALAPKEVLVAVEVPRLSAAARAVAYKVSKRRELDISVVSAGFLVEVDASGQVTRARLAYGGMAATPKRAAQAEAALVARAWTAQNVDAAAKALAGDFTPISDHRGSAPYRAAVAANLLRGFFEETRQVHQPALQPRHVATVQSAEEVRHA